MADNNQTQRRFGTLFERMRIGILNRFQRMVGYRRGMRAQPQMTREGVPAAADILRELQPLIDLKENLLNRLEEIEVQWKQMDPIVWDDPENSVANIYSKMSILTNPDIYIDDKGNDRLLEGSFYRTGTFVDNIPKVHDIGAGLPRRETREWRIGSNKLFYIEPDFNVYEEEISAIGYTTMAQVRQSWANSWIFFDREASKKSSDYGGAYDFAINFNNLVTDFFDYIDSPDKGRESNYHNDWIAVAETKIRTLAGKREDIMKLAPKNVRFSHTYKIIQPVIRNPNYEPRNPVCQQYDAIGNPNPTYDPNNIVCKPILYFKDAYPNFRRPDEVESGKDENGYPLEVEKVDNLLNLTPIKDKNAPGIWIVLLDKWWKEIASNNWQKDLITTTGYFEYPAGSGIRYKGKGDGGGAEIWDVKVTNGVQRYGIRQVPEEFVKDLDLLDMAVYVYVEFDSYRDDLRDGRYHRWSKTTTDYIMAGEGISTKDVTTFGTMPYARGLLRHIPKDDITLRSNPLTDYINTTPSDFVNVPEDEKKVIGDYVMKLNPLPQSTDPYRTDPNDEHATGVRRPAHLNPAFDRRALNIPANNFIHWGRMYYYEDTNGINRWSENPFTKISTRGLSKWIIYRILIDLPVEDAIRTAKLAARKGYDYGIRRPLVGGDFIKDPLGGSDLISNRSPF